MADSKHQGDREELKAQEADNATTAAESNVAYKLDEGAGENFFAQGKRGTRFRIDANKHQLPRRERICAPALF